MLSQTSAPPAARTARMWPPHRLCVLFAHLLLRCVGRPRVWLRCAQTPCHQPSAPSARACVDAPPHTALSLRSLSLSLSLSLSVAVYTTVGGLRNISACPPRRRTRALLVHACTLPLASPIRPPGRCPLLRSGTRALCSWPTQTWRGASSGTASGWGPRASCTTRS